MNLVQDFVSLVGGCLSIQALVDRPALVTSTLVGIALGGVCWLGCSQYSKLWNLRYRVTVTHHLLCLLAMLITLGGSILFFALKHTKEAAYGSVGIWVIELQSDKLWSDQTFLKAYNKVKALGLEDFSAYPLSRRTIPANHKPSVLGVAGTYANSAAQHFCANRPFLSLVVRAKAEVPSQIMESDINSYFAAGNSTYPNARGITLVAREIKSGLDTQVPRVVTLARGICIGLLMLFQLVPFGLVGIAAYKDIKTVT